MPFIDFFCLFVFFLAGGLLFFLAGVAEDEADLPPVGLVFGKFPFGIEFVAGPGLESGEGDRLVVQQLPGLSGGDVGVPEPVKAVFPQHELASLLVTRAIEGLFTLVDRVPAFRALAQFFAPVFHVRPPCVLMSGGF